MMILRSYVQSVEHLYVEERRRKIILKKSTCVLGYVVTGIKVPVFSYGVAKTPVVANMDDPYITSSNNTSDCKSDAAERFSVLFLVLHV